jgi:hypothetical protein
MKEKVAAPVYKTEINDRGNPLRWPRNTLYPQNLALTSPTSGGRSVGIVHDIDAITLLNNGRDIRLHNYHHGAQHFVSELIKKVAFYKVKSSCIPEAHHSCERLWNPWKISVLVIGDCVLPKYMSGVLALQLISLVGIMCLCRYHVIMSRICWFIETNL